MSRFEVNVDNEMEDLVVHIMAHLVKFGEQTKTLKGFVGEGERYPSVSVGIKMAKLVFPAEPNSGWGSQVFLYSTEEAVDLDEEKVRQAWRDMMSRPTHANWMEGDAFRKLMAKGRTPPQPASVQNNRWPPREAGLEEGVEEEQRAGEKKEG